MNLGAREPEKIEAQMAPMIDVVFQLLIFFMLTLKITKDEGDFGINMPIGQSSEVSEELPPTNIQVRLVANADGTLQSVRVEGFTYPNDETVWDRVNQKITGLAGQPTNGPNDDIEVTIDADYNLHYNNTIQAVSAATGRVINGQPVRYVNKVKFAPPRRPE